MTDQDEHELDKCRGQNLAGMRMKTIGTRKDNDKSNQSMGGQKNGPQQRR